MEFYYNPPIEPWLNILYQDEEIMVVDKPAELLSVPGKGAELHDSIITRVQWEFPTAETVHRLDMSTSGILVIALTKAAERELKRQFRERETYKRYIADVFGIMEEEGGIIHLPLICDWERRPRQMVCFERGKEAITAYQILFRNRQENFTRVSLNPLTGRSHQLRVHLLSLGHVILGDRFYAQGVALQQRARLALHASELKFIHPSTKEALHFKVAPPF
ncbi:bifunctional tRNA pseudouridine(32) synthase/23S rRNA pseudouridine(746) synthase RluA [Ignatzschineria cameli]|uniref:Dual-specificity RNA pseudouridine synthase RluA n=1 Tax=Ignatzschineria cameli TaxID=2182793 RepID=A0A2U2ATX8_9GAMM|nr:bifunctional tRNA pseudouridine(32) synthase/23S rRNA pseudouridine(746) synthase RluA [Ignatzschineria cameli]PWD87328.1 bifunctional tRNA pseudouridine(32) synthase/23S rRNA pseudouridine(746) synthase RluA [Ignatzschineria cameli]PWD88184.1 bifunctional tRNA pseudouridine(32) synthase/23S rRNA pseudouridine(746) synthase RluA [Ignatzschineria cameli]PWD91213.1 bifunctional tRNA pseudouridine(32) synthase/23S rRNA pseudouridine(746) synthase RluA [Ignatzschineria cameli]PWD92854.1 bifuncti